MEAPETPFEEDTTLATPENNEEVEVPTEQTNSEEIELTPEEYKIKADELEARLNRLEDRANKDLRLAQIFHSQKLPVTVQAMEPKGKYI